MSYAKGYYSIIQYCPDASRLETVNLGVALFCPELRFLEVKFGRRRTQVSQLFGKQDWEFVDLQQSAIEERLEGDREMFQTLGDFQTYVSRRANALIMTNPRPVKVEDPILELDHLLGRLVGASSQRQHRAPRIDKQLGTVFQDAGVVSRLRPNVTVAPPSLPKPVKVPFAYRNGRLNLIEPVSFEGKSAGAVFRAASVKAVEGEYVNEYRESDYGDLNFVVVAKFAAGQERELKTVKEVLGRHRVEMHEFGELESLIHDIRRHAH